MAKKTKILAIVLEFSSWQYARAWSYISSYAFLNGLEENDIEIVWLPAVIEPNNNQPDLLFKLDKLFPEGGFDQVWTWLVHIDYPQEFWDWAHSNVSTIVGITMESLQMTSAEITEFPHLGLRQEFVLEQGSHCTHILCADEADVPLVEKKCKIPATFYPQAVPEDFISYQNHKKVDKASFLGAVYGERKLFLAHESIEEFVDIIAAPETETTYPEQFDNIMRDILSYSTTDISYCSLKLKLNQLIDIRKALFTVYLNGLSQFKGNINLPSIFKSFAGRVADSMMTGVPVLTWQPQDRPQINSLFESEKEIFYFNSPTSLLTQVEGLIKDDERLSKAVTDARNKLANAHTSRVRVRQILNWLKEGEPIDFSKPIGYIPTYEESKYYENFFVNTPVWSKSTPNKDELSRLHYIDQYVRAIRKNSKQPLKILEVGCGRGWLSEHLSQYGEVTAIDPIGEVISHAKQMYPHINFITGDTNLMCFLGFIEQYDVVVSSEVIEHIPNSHKQEFISNCHLMLKPNGHFVISTPRRDIQDQWEDKYGKPPQPTEQWITESSLEKLCNDNQLKSVELNKAFLMDIYQIWLFRKQLVSS